MGELQVSPNGDGLSLSLTTGEGFLGLPEMDLLVYDQPEAAALPAATALPTQAGR